MPSSHPTVTRLRRLPGTFSNPGQLDAHYFVPASVQEPCPLVVVLHGCTQSAAGYDAAAGWTALAERHGFAVLYPEQRQANNPNRCFSWFEPGDTRRGHGEAASIAAMITRLSADHAIDASRIFITGLSAGAAMANVMLATYPELFAGGGLIAGLPYGVAGSVGDALREMRTRGPSSAARLRDLVRSASRHGGPWPRISIWHGSRDTTVHPANADATLAQWLAVHGLDSEAADLDSVDGYPRRVWRDGGGGACVEFVSVTGMGHGTPLDIAHSGKGERAAPFMLDVGISSSQHIAAFWGLIDSATLAERLATSRAPKPAPQASAGFVQRTIEDALRSAGLMR